MDEHDFRLLQERVYANAKAHGFHDTQRDPAVSIALMHSELSELLESYRKGHQNEPSDHAGLMLSESEEELADVVIRCMDFAEEQDIDLWSAILAKHAYNVSRPYKHGKLY